MGGSEKFFWMCYIENSLMKCYFEKELSRISPLKRRKVWPPLRCSLPNRPSSCWGLRRQEKILIGIFDANFDVFFRKKHRYILSRRVHTVTVIWNCRYSTVLGHFVTENLWLHELWNLLSIEICQHASLTHRLLEI